MKENYLADMIMQISDELMIFLDNQNKSEYNNKELSNTIRAVKNDLYPKDNTPIPCIANYVILDMQKMGYKYIRYNKST